MQEGTKMFPSDLIGLVFLLKLGIEGEDQVSLAAPALRNDRERKGRMFAPHYCWSRIET